DIYTQRVTAAGGALWSINGIALCTATGHQYNPVTTSDGAGGAIVSWEDYRGGPGDIYAQRVNAGGTPQWTNNGVALCSAPGDQLSPTITSDGAGGAIVTWQDGRGAISTDVYAQRVTAAGVVQWTANGVAICTAAGDQTSHKIVSDGAGG